MNNKYIPILLITLLLGVISSNLLLKKPTAPATNSGEPMGGDFTLHSMDGDVSLHDLTGKVALVFFGYTYCPDVCPTSLARISEAFKQLSEEELAQTKGVFISVDPKRDTPEKLKAYTQYFHPNIIGLTGGKDEIDRVSGNYGASYKITQKHSESAYLIDHTALIFVLDTDGKIREFLPHATSVNGVTSVIRKYIAEKSSITTPPAS
ncbi:MAG: Cytochrome oxidase biogenesis protein Sco1/SenC/PrrC, putative copper metallochaperone [uncultured Thiotrichaceae bacterium]|uniref:Cytochrome oxidase biogenesis protein Sco1/SenC/PrrC, putative copper metallochaperone n=1 Tax=uncultured Thiotrichaceae bacterium TaxID=298394 RepID=A0A6S6SH41_9GAMM|nr:MAG: Cytochrome oxidase biogenesis protein Sco1/SenC/PrrC, putative copper metallochaperone [uncultured Thiotrichaceae bacterium]